MEKVTLVAALIAAVGSVTGVLLQVVLQTFASRSSEMRAAQRITLQPYLARLASALHQVIAISDIYMKRYPRQDVDGWREKGKQVQEKLKKLRWEVRYFLWGLDEGLRTMSHFFDWVTHLQDYPDKAEYLLKQGDELRRALDDAIRNAYVRGTGPSWKDRWKVNKSVKRVQEARYVVGIEEET